MLSNSHQNTLFDFLTQPGFRVWRHLLFIVGFVPISLSQAFFTFNGSPAVSTSTIYVFGVCLAVTLIAFVYFNIYVLAARFLPEGEYASYVIALLISVSGFVLVKYTAEYFIFLKADIIREFNGITVLDGLSNLMLYTICIASGSITLLFKRWLAGNAEIESLESKQLKNSIEEIKNSIQPTFLYATLDYAAEQVKYEPEQTSDTLFKVSELLRYQLYDCRRNKVLLASDIGFIRNYLTLEQQTSEHKLSFTISVRGGSNQLIPPALFIPWIEEITRQHPAALDVKFAIEDCWVKFQCGVPNTDLSHCDFSKIADKQKRLYGDDIVIEKGLDSITLQLNIC